MGLISGLNICWSLFSPKSFWFRSSDRSFKSSWSRETRIPLYRSVRFISGELTLESVRLPSIFLPATGHFVQCLTSRRVDANPASFCKPSSSNSQSPLPRNLGFSPKPARLTRFRLRLLRHFSIDLLVSAVSTVDFSSPRGIRLAEQVLVVNLDGIEALAEVHTSALNGCDVVISRLSTESSHSSVRSRLDRFIRGCCYIASTSLRVVRI